MYNTQKKGNVYHKLEKKGKSMMTCARPTRAKFQKNLGDLKKLGNIGSFKTS